VTNYPELLPSPEDLGFFSALFELGSSGKEAGLLEPPGASYLSSSLAAFNINDATFESGTIIVS